MGNGAAGGRGAGPLRFRAWTMDPYDACALLAACGRAVLEVMLHKAAHALAVVHGVRDPAPRATGTTTSDSRPWATEIGLAGPERPEKVVRWSDCPTHRRDDGRLCGRHQRDRRRAAFPFLPADHGAPQLDINAVSGITAFIRLAARR